MKKLLGYLLVASTIFCVPLVAQNRTRFGGFASAFDYAFGVNPNVPALINDSAPTTAGQSATLTLRVGAVTAADGTLFAPFGGAAGQSSSVVPFIFFTIASGSAAQETVQATAVSCTTPLIQDSCQVTATFTNSHAQGERIVSADYGVQEAVNYLFSTNGSGKVLLGPDTTKAGFTSSTIGSYTTPVPSVPLEDNRGQYPTYWSTQPTVLTLISAPSALTSATVVQPAACPTGASCTWTAAEPDFCIAYVDILGQLSACSTAYAPSSNLTASLPVNITAPAASAGAVGWIAFAGTTQNVSYLLPVTTSAGVANGACTLTTLEQAIPACALTNSTYGQVGSSASFNTLYSNTNMQASLAANATANISNPVYQAHTAFAYQPTGSLPSPFQSNFTPWPANTATESANNVTILGTVNFPTGFLNTVSRSIRISGKLVATVTTASTPEVVILDGWIGGYSSGAPSKTLCTLLTVGTPTGTSDLISFTATITVNASGTTAVGSATCNGTAVFQAGTALPIAAIDSGTATPVASIGLFSSNQLFIEFVNTATGSSAAQLIDTHVETLQ